MNTNLNKQLGRSIAMIEMATKKLYERRTGEHVEVHATMPVDGKIKVIVKLPQIEADSQETALYAAGCMLNELTISEVLLQQNIPQRRITVDNFNFDWIMTECHSGHYSAIGELILGVKVELFQDFNHNISTLGEQLMFRTTSAEYITLECVTCDVEWVNTNVA